jgi:hypothetical protein
MPMPPSFSTAYYAFLRNIEGGRREFQKVYGYPYDDKERIGQILLDALERAADGGVVELPAHVVLALLLEEGMGRRAHRRRSSLPRPGPFAIAGARIKEEKLLRGGKLTKAEARKRTAEAMSKDSVYTEQEWMKFLRRRRKKRRVSESAEISRRIRR